MQYVFKITDEKFREAKKLIIRNGGVIYTDNTFEISGVEGNFYLNDGEITINITDKPWLASWDMIESKLNSFFR